MSQVLEARIIDYSTPDEFCFALRCDECGEEKRSVPVAFSRCGIRPQSQSKELVYDILYRREKEAAMNRALLELRSKFNICPVCFSLVCDHCFLVCDDLDMCASCAEKLHECGEPVLKKA